MEFARAVTGQDPFGKFPVSNGTAVIVGKDSKHLGRVIYAKLFRAGAFTMIRDLDTGNWRPFRAWDLSDQVRKPQSKPVPPLIPRRYVKEIGWEKKSEKVPSIITLTTGWEIYFYSSLAMPAQGFPADLVWFDEEIVESSWYAEMVSRTVDRAGKLIWSAAPQLATPQLYDLHVRALDDAGMPDRQIEEFKITLADNVHLDEKEKVALERALDETDADVRVRGGWAIEGYRVLHDFQPSVHLVDPFAVPPHWTNYMLVDPGTRVCGVLRVSVPPPDDARHGARVYVTDELYIKRCSAKIFGETVKRRFESVQFRAFFMDARSARAVEIGAGKSIHQQYAEALAENGISCEETGHNFHYGSTDRDGRIEAIRKWLAVPGDGRPPVLGIFKCCPNLIREINGYHYRVMANGQVTDQPVERNDHLVWCLGAAAQYTCPYRKPKAVRHLGGAYQALQRKRKRQRDKSGTQDGVIRLGPPQQE